ncbi:MAG: hypothetical protein K0R27_1462 [Xanthobacteraceae bacterium]|jgi:hypothetical protein|nr:hypothetical protein [Xanthobacteraceae bacterium]
MKRKKVSKPRPRTPRQQAWANSARFRSMGRAMMKRFNNLRRSGPKCGAHTKINGHPCQNPAMANGRCRVHGGATPKGDGWHKPVWPDANAANWNAKLARKLTDLERAAKKRARRLRSMTPEQRADHAAWQRSHKPGSTKAREAAKAYRQQEADMAATLRRVREQPMSEESRAIAARIAEIEAENAVLAARLAELDAPNPQPSDDMGIFG